MKNAFGVTCIALFSVWGSGPATAQKLEPAQSEIAFTIRQLGVPVEGHFTRFNGQFAFDPGKPQTGKVTLNIDTGSARFGAPEADSEMPKAAWFNASRFPQAALESAAIKPTGAGKFELTGKLSIKGTARDVQVPVTLTRSGALTFATGAFVVKRLDFKIGEGEWSDTSIVANEVQVKFRLALSGMAALQP
jgi:polyisoprenoid-binding protein YceI